VSSQSRHTFLDLFRGLFVLLMIEGHLIRTVLDGFSQSLTLFQLHEILHGITAPGFLFTSGFALAIASHRKRNELQSLSPLLFQRLWRGLALVLLGYILHVPYWSLTKTLTASTAEQWNALVAFGVLQLIGTVILLVRLLFYLIRDDRLFLGVLSLLFLSAVYLTPMMWDSAVTGSLNEFLRAAVSGSSGSPFPIFPFAGFFIAGTVVSWLFLDQVGVRGERWFMQMLALAGVVCTVAGIAGDLLPISLFGKSDFWYTGPSYFWIRLGILLLLMSSFWFLEHLHSQAPDVLPFNPHWISTLGRESYFVYIVHLFVIFGWLVNPFTNLRVYFGGQLTWIPALALAVALIAALVVLSSAWHGLKKEHPPVVQGLIAWFWITTSYYIVFNPF